MAAPLIVMALESESQGKLEAAGHEVLYTGVGKVNATYHLTRALAERKATRQAPSIVINLGTAGSPRYPFASIVAAHRFVQRDMDATGIGFAPGETPFDPSPIILESKPYFTQLPSGICGSGDSFLQGVSPMPCDVIDMEAYAYAKVCHLMDVPFACAKFVTDGADDAAHTDWTENLRHAAEAFVTLLK